MKKEKQAYSKGFYFTLWSFLFLLVTGGVVYATTISDTTSTFTGNLQLGNNIVNASNLYFGNGTNGFGNFSGNRRLVSTETKTVTVCDSGCDYTTFNSALHDVPYFLNHKYVIQGQTPYSAHESLYVPPVVVSSDMQIDNIAGAGLEIKGICESRETIDDIKLNSIHVISSKGALTPYIRCFAVNGTDPNNDELASIAIIGSTDVQIQSINLSGTNAEIGVLAYSSGVSVAQVDLGVNNLERGFQSKHTGYFHFEDSVTSISANVSNTANVIGSVNNYVYSNLGGVPWAFNKNGATGSLGTAESTRGQILDATNGILYGVTTFVDTMTFGNQNADHHIEISGDRGRVGYESSSSPLGFAYTYLAGGSSKGSALITGATSTNNGYHALIADQNGNVRIGEGDVQRNITMTSPNGTEYSCGVSNGGVFSCA